MHEQGRSNCLINLGIPLAKSPDRLKTEPMRESLLASRRQSGQKQDRDPALPNHNAIYRPLLSPYRDFASSIARILLANSSEQNLCEKICSYRGAKLDENRTSTPTNSIIMQSIGAVCRLVVISPAVSVKGLREVEVYGAKVRAVRRALSGV